MPRHREDSFQSVCEPEMPHHTPQYVALADVDTYAGSGDDLNHLLAELADEGEDCAIWTREGTLAAIIHRGQSRILLGPETIAAWEPAPPPPRKKGRQFSPSIRRRAPLSGK
jgi:hypothetical protein